VRQVLNDRADLANDQAFNIQAALKAMISFGWKAEVGSLLQRRRFPETFET